MTRNSCRTAVLLVLLCLGSLGGGARAMDVTNKAATVHPTWAKGAAAFKDLAAQALKGRLDLPFDEQAKGADAFAKLGKADVAGLSLLEMAAVEALFTVKDPRVKLDNAWHALTGSYLPQMAVDRIFAGSPWWVVSNEVAVEPKSLQATEASAAYDGEEFLNFRETARRACTNAEATFTQSGKKHGKPAFKLASPVVVPGFKQEFVNELQALASRPHGGALVATLLTQLEKRKKTLIVLPFGPDPSMLPDVTKWDAQPKDLSMLKQELSVLNFTLFAAPLARDVTKKGVEFDRNSKTPGPGASAFLPLTKYYLSQEVRVKALDKNKAEIDFPSQILIGHELIHVLHIIHGLAVPSQVPKVKAGYPYPELEEERTISCATTLAEFAELQAELVKQEMALTGQPVVLCENLLRQEWNLPARVGHGGKSKGALFNEW
jgi:hypothetical protein